MNGRVECHLKRNPHGCTNTTKHPRIQFTINSVIYEPHVPHSKHTECGTSFPVKLRVPFHSLLNYVIRLEMEITKSNVVFSEANQAMKYEMKSTKHMTYQHTLSGTKKRRRKQWSTFDHVAQSDEDRGSNG